MRRAQRTIALGDLIAAAFDEATAVAGDAKRHARVATEVVAWLLCQTGNARTARRLARAT
jgi:hypothetical protein